MSPRGPPGENVPPLPLHSPCTLGKRKRKPEAGSRHNSLPIGKLNLNALGYKIPPSPNQVHPTQNPESTATQDLEE